MYITYIKLLEKDLAEQKAKNEFLELRLSSLEKLHSSTECSKSHDFPPPRPNPKPTTSNLINAEKLVINENAACSNRDVNCRGGRSHNNRNRPVGSHEVGNMCVKPSCQITRLKTRLLQTKGQKRRHRTRLGVTESVLRNKAEVQGDRTTFGKNHRSGVVMRERESFGGKRKLWGMRKSDTEACSYYKREERMLHV